MPEYTTIRTAQNVLIKLPIAGLEKRIFAYIIDTLIQGGIVGVLFFFLSFLASADMLSQTVMIILMVIISLPFIFYHFLFEVFNEGQSPGKRALHIKVVSENGERASVTQYFLRWILRFIDFTILSGLVALIVAASNKKHQRVGDLVAKTLVILTKEGVAANTIKLNIEDDYEPMYLKVSEFSDEEIEAIKDVLNLPVSGSRDQLIDDIAGKISLKYQLRYDGTSKKFLYDLLKDHQFLISREEEDLYDDSDLV